MKACYLVALLVCGSVFAVTEHEMVLRLEHASVAGGPYVEVVVGPEMLHEGRMNAGRVTNGAGFWRLAGEVVAVATPVPTPTPTPVPMVDVVAVEAGSLSRSWSTAVWVNGFVIGRYEVTREIWDAVREWGSSRGYDLPASSGAGPEFPAGGVSWYDAVKFCNALSEWAGLAPVYRVDGAVFRSGDHGASVSPVVSVGGSGWRLPSEAEWEFAAKGGSLNENTTYVGSNTSSLVAWHAGNASSAQRVGQKSGNAIGIYDMSGNVSEWCEEVATANWPPRRMRSGSYVHAESAVRLTRRSEQSPEVRSAWTGFRLARTP